MEKVFITFGAGSPDFHDAVKRLLAEVAELRLFDRLIGYTEEDLKRDQPFWKRHRTFIQRNKRGYGYWIWKPYLILKTLRCMKEGDILLFLDCGCEIDLNQRSFFDTAFKEVKKQKILYTSTGLKEFNWTKMDTILGLDAASPKILTSDQLQGGILMIEKCKQTMNLLEKWYKYSCRYHYIDDTPSRSKNLDGFVEHRHDQSIFSLLVKRLRLDNSFNLQQKCIISARNKTGKKKYASLHAYRTRKSRR